MIGQQKHDGIRLIGKGIIPHPLITDNIRHRNPVDQADNSDNQPSRSEYGALNDKIIPSSVVSSTHGSDPFWKMRPAAIPLQNIL